MELNIINIIIVYEISGQPGRHRLGGSRGGEGSPQNPVHFPRVQNPQRN